MIQESLKETTLHLNKVKNFYRENPKVIKINISYFVEVREYKEHHLAFYIGDKYIKPYDGKPFRNIIKKYRTKSIVDRDGSFPFQRYPRFAGDEIMVSKSMREKLLLEYLDDNQPLDEIKWIISLKKMC